MKLADVRRLKDLGPLDRAAQVLVLGGELKKQRKRRYPRALRPGKEPRSFRETHLGDAVAFLRELHGIRQPRMGRRAGLRKTGALETAIGRTDELVLTPQKRKKQCGVALRRAGREGVADLAERQLLLAMMDRSPHPRLCAAYAYWQATGATHVALPILSKGIRSREVEEFDIAAHCLAHMGSPGAKLLRPFVGTAADDRPHSPVLPWVPSMTVLVHGTFAKDQTWYRPGGSFHRYIRREVFPDVYGGADFFRWSGRYRNDARREAARKLVRWCAEHPTGTLRLIAHSHGANVVNIATTLGLQACTLIHLSPPVHDRYMPRMSNVSSQRLFTIRPRIDLIVLIDGGRQDYRNTPVEAFERRRICALSGHSTSHERTRWRKKKVPSLVKTVCP